MNIVPSSLMNFSAQSSWDIFDSFPDVGSIVRGVTETFELWQEEDEAGRKVLATAGYLFVASYFRPRSFSAYESVPRKVRPAVITTALRASTVDETFTKRMGTAFSHSPMLKRRWRFVQRAFDAHRNRDYILSVPILLAQFEGLLGDILVARSLLEKDGNKLYRIDPLTGKRMLDKGKKPKPIEARGLDKLIERSGYRKDPLWEDMATHVANTIVHVRNGVLHGRDLKYDTAKTSTTVVLLIATLVDIVIALEDLTE